MITIVYIYHIYNCRNMPYITIVEISYDYYYTNILNNYNWIKYIICLQLYKYMGYNTSYDV